MNKELMELIVDESRRFSGNALVQWKPTAKTKMEAPADRTLLSRHLYLAEPFRKPKSYPRQRNYYGLYYFSQTKTHVWHESLNEANMMMYLDHVESITAINSQPMEIRFADGLRHVPDLMALHSNHRQVVYDIKPTAKITSKALEQFAKTQAVCTKVGWGYEVLAGLPEQVQTNLSWLNYFHHPLFAPEREATSRLLAALTAPARFDEAAHILSPQAIAYGRSALFHLLWLRVVRADMSARINGNTLIERSPHAHA
ncbi:TnsA-like heteromeric transposase endonuclease subunit [Cryobacterium sp. MDB2-10]|uniref:TnsA-like heteromeric transposase endonuclease subunit n=1 Tax=Cryobacterium sp. MDB2-10 TaxID=1259177 RepID=UPI001430CB4F|nr:TnsA-like heteromeric transposase endonuclease subunit [Cryobacterium sp. MDB2-10]